MKAIKRYEISDSVEVMASTLFDLPYNMYDSSVETLEMTKALGRLKERLQSIEDKTIIYISNELDSNGKPKFSNQSVREAEMRIRLAGNDDYQDLKSQIEDVKVDVSKMKEQARTYADLFKTIQNEVYHRRALELLDNKKEFNKEKTKMCVSD